MMQSFDGQQEKPRAENALRSDKEILDEITRRLRDDQFLKEFDIQVTVVQGDVILEGNVPSPNSENLLVEIVTSVPGVRQIQNLVRVGVGLDVQDAREASGFPEDPLTSENRNVATPGVQVPSMQTPSEVVPFTQESMVQEEGMGTPLPRDGINVTPSGGIDTTHFDDLHQGHEGAMAHQLKEGMVVVDSQGKKIGKVKEVRSTDFLLGRLFARGIYVPHLECKIDGEQVILDVTSDEVDKQGWAIPHIS